MACSWAARDVGLPSFFALRTLKGTYVISRLDRFGSAGRLHRQQTGQQNRRGFFLDIVLGIVGAVVGGWLFNAFGAQGVTGVNLYSLLVAVVGSVVLLLVYHTFRRAM